MCCIMCNMKMFDSCGVKLRISTFITFIMNLHILRESPRRETPRSRTPQPERADLLIDEESIKRSSSPKSEKSVIMCSPSRRWKVRWSFAVRRNMSRRTGVAASSYTTEVDGNKQINKKLMKFLRAARPSQSEIALKRLYIIYIKCVDPGDDRRGRTDAKPHDLLSTLEDGGTTQDN